MLLENISLMLFALLENICVKTTVVFFSERQPVTWQSCSVLPSGLGCTWGLLELSVVKPLSCAACEPLKNTRMFAKGTLSRAFQQLFTWEYSGCRNNLAGTKHGHSGKSLHIQTTPPPPPHPNTPPHPPHVRKPAE